MFRQKILIQLIQEHIKIFNKKKLFKNNIRMIIYIREVLKKMNLLTIYQAARLVIRV
jgi:hypothetical protein